MNRIRLLHGIWRPHIIEAGRMKPHLVDWMELKWPALYCRQGEVVLYLSLPRPLKDFEYNEWSVMR
jgi:hypothetical protein